MKKKVIALVEVVAVFCLTLLLLAALGSSPIGAWQRGVTNRAFLEYALMIAVPLLLLLASRRNLVSYGIPLHNLRYHLDVTVTRSGLSPLRAPPSRSLTIGDGMALSS
ncbi:MAG TPA: hypothetical protein VMX56_09085 [Anaerolineales bacterium]|nr:hypothetical protein [Anaerolineales bacterium]